MPKSDIYQDITNDIVRQLEAGVMPWRKPWNAEHLAGRITRPLRANGEAYRGINIIVLWMTSVMKGYVAPIWMTYKQAAQLGGQVRRGETSTKVVFAKTFTKTDDINGESVEREIPFMKAYAAFNVEQIEGLPAHFYAIAEPQISDLERIESADWFFENLPAEVHHGGNEAYYTITHDRIQLPPFETFESAEAYYMTRGHETAHWTRHPTRLDRDFGRKRWGDEAYAQEELVAEIAACFLAADLGLRATARPESASYISHWLEGLKNDKRFIFQAAAHAQKAVDFMHAFQNAGDAVAEAA